MGSEFQASEKDSRKVVALGQLGTLREPKEPCSQGHGKPQGFAGHVVSVAINQLCLGSIEAGRGDKHTSGRGCLPIKLYSRKPAGVRSD